MSFLAENRQRAADFQWARAGDLAHKVQDQIRYESGLGKVEVTVSVVPEDYIKGTHLIEALKLEGFTVGWRDHRRQTIVINWEVRLPRP